MLIPQFSLRWMLAVTSVLAVFFLVVSRAVQGSSWAVGVSSAVLMLGVVAAVHGAMFFLIWLVSLWTGRPRRPAVAPMPQPATPFQSNPPGSS